MAVVPSPSNVETGFVESPTLHVKTYFEKWVAGAELLALLF